MIVRPRPTIWQLFFILKGSVILRIFPQMIAVFLLSTIIVVAHRMTPGLVPGGVGAPFALLGIALSIFLGFRNNACYDRWWEARKFWGQLVYSARGFGRQTVLLEALHGDDGIELRRRLLQLTIALPHAMVSYLRPGVGDAKTLRNLPADLHAGFLAARNPPDMVVKSMAYELVQLRASGRLTDIQYQMLDTTLDQMAIVQASCERIRFTPVPFGYTLLLHRTAHLFCLLLPFGFADVLGWGTPFVSLLVAYTFFGLDALGDELEEPFGSSPNDLPIEAIADVIEINLREAMGETDLPPAPQPRDFILM